MNPITPYTKLQHDLVNLEIKKLILSLCDSYLMSLHMLSS